MDYEFLAWAAYLEATPGNTDTSTALSTTLGGGSAVYLSEIYVVRDVGTMTEFVVRETGVGQQLWAAIVPAAASFSSGALTSQRLIKAEFELTVVHSAAVAGKIKVWVNYKAKG